MEACLDRFLRRHHLELTSAGRRCCAAFPAEQACPPTAVYSIDWYHPTAGETGPHTPAFPPPVTSQVGAASVNTPNTPAVINSPAGRSSWPPLRHLATAQRYAMIREQQTRELTLGWPRHAIPPAASGRP